MAIGLHHRVFFGLIKTAKQYVVSFHRPASSLSVPRPFHRWLLLLVFASCLLSVAHAQVLLSVNDTSVTEGDGGPNLLTFTLSLSEPAAGVVTVNYSTSGFSAAEGSDFAPTNGLAAFNPGETNFAVSVVILGDTLNEADEVLWLNLADPVGALLVDNRGDGTILNDDPLPSLTIGNATVVEGDAGPTNAIFPVSLSTVSGRTVMAQFSTQSGNAIVGTDFAPAADTLSFPPGITNGNIVVTVTGDTLDENNETFTVAITNAINATPPASLATGTIMDDDSLPLLNLGDVTLLEGTGGSTPAVFPLTLSVPSGRTLTVDFQTINGTATSGSDFTTTNGTLTFAPGVTNLLLAISVAADSNVEGTENFSLRLTAPVNVSLVRTQATATLLDDETRTLTFTNGAPIVAALSGAADPYPTPIELSGLVGNVVKVTATLAGLTHSFPDDLDILLVGPLGQTVMLMSDCGGGNPINNLTLTFDDTAFAPLADNGQLTSGNYRPSDYVTTDVFVGPAPGGPYGSSLNGFNGLNPNGTWSLFVFDDSADDSGALSRGWALSITLSNLICCTGGNSDLSVTVTDSPDPVTATSNLTYTARIINNGPAGATGTTFTNFLPAGVNLLSATSSHGTLTTNATQIVGNLSTVGVGVQVTVTFVVSPTTFGAKTNRLTVQSDKADPDLANNTALTPNTVSQLAPLLRIADATTPEGDWGSTNLLFNVSLSRTSAIPVTASFATVAGSAAANTDYLTITDVVTFTPGVTNIAVAIPVLGDITVEPNENFTVLLTGYTNALLADGTAVGTISNDDGLPLKVQSFTWSSVAATQYVGVPIPVTVTARDINNNVATTFTGPAKLSAITGSGPDVSVVIAEIDTDANDAVEFVNVAGAPVDISGWQVSFYDWFRWPAPAASFVVPPGNVCGPNEVFTISDNGSAPGAYPNFSLGENLFWTNEDSTNMVAVLVRDADGRLIDFVCAVDAYPGEITMPIFIPANQWTGPPITANTNTALTYRRTGGSDSQQAGNFTIGNPDLGSLNPELQLPFTGTRALATSPASVPTFVNGVWTGEVVVSQPATSATLRASDIPGHIGVSTAFTVLPAADLAIGVTADASAVAVGQALTFTLRATNISTTTASSVMLTNTLPPGFSFVSASTSQGSFTTAGSLVTFSLGTVSPAAIITATVQAAPTLGGLYTNRASAGANPPEAITANSVAQVNLFVNSPPAFTPLATQYVNEGSTLTVTNIATDPDLPANTLAFALVSGPPGATVTGNGVFTWTTTEANGPGTNLITVRVQDNSTPNLSATQSWSVVVSEVNSPPILQPVANQTIASGGTLVITNSVSDPDLPANALTFSLVAAPANANLSAGGVFTWTPVPSQAGTNVVTLRVIDNGAPALSATQTFLVIVTATNVDALRIASINLDPGATTALFTGPAGYTYVVESRLPGSGNWIKQGEVIAAPVNFTVTARESMLGQQKFYRIRNLTLPYQPPVIAARFASNGFFYVGFTAEAGRNYVVEARPALSSGTWTAVTNVALAAVNVPLSFDTSGLTPREFRVTRYALPAPAQRIDRIERFGTAVNLTFSLAPGLPATLESSANLVSGSWTIVTNLPAFSSLTSLRVTDPMTGGPKFYRLNFTVPSAPVTVTGQTTSSPTMRLQFAAISNKTYTVEYRNAVAGGSWLTLTNLPAWGTNGMRLVTDPFISQPQRYYRLRTP